MLKGATEEVGGTAQGIGMDIREGNEIGGKTGTTNNASDGWFIGVTENLVAGAWVGGDDRSIHSAAGTMVRVPGQPGQSGKILCGPFMKMKK
jgi:penicillin-binding protein 1A